MTVSHATRFRLPALLGVVLLAVAADRGLAQTLTWRTDYNTARREAAEKGKPLLIDFGTDNCVWCKQLERTTFRDPAVASVMAERFVLLKIDGDREINLVQALRIQSYPTLILAAPDGKILGMIEGYREPARLSEHLNRALNAVATPDWMARDLQDAGRAVAAADYARAVALLKTIVEDGKDRPVQVKAKQLLQELEQQAAGRLARVRQMQDAGQILEAADALSELLRAYAGTQSAQEGSRMLAALATRPEIRDRNRAGRAKELLAQAREDFRKELFFGCMEKCELLASTYADLPEAAEAARLSASVKEQ